MVNITFAGYKLSQIKKAIVAGTIAFGGSLTTAASDGVIKWYEWLFIVGTTLGAFAGVFGTKNARSGRKP